MVAMDVQLDKQSEAFLLDMARRFPRELRRAFYYAAGQSRKVLRGQMNGKNDEVARWDDFTRRVRRYQLSRGYEPAKKFGGKLMWPKGKQLVLKKEGDRVRVGWVGTLEDAAIKFQNGGVEPTSSAWRHYLYKSGKFEEGEVPREANTPARPVVDNTARKTERHLADWTLGALDKFLRERIARLDFKYKKNTWTREGARAATQSAEAQEAVNDLMEFSA